MSFSYWILFPVTDLGSSITPWSDWS